MAAGDAQRAGLRIPQLRRTTAKQWAPARGAGEIIDDDRIIAPPRVAEHEATVAGRVSQKIGGCQVGAIVKRPVSDASDAVGNGDAGQVETTVKSPDVGDSGRNH